MDDQNIAIKVHGVSKFFSPSAGQQTIKQIITRQFKKDKKYTQSGYWAVKNANFEFKKGEFFGIVGRNGSGKSTLLKMMAGVYTPTKGAISVNGKLVPFIELGVGFNAELSGRDNVFLNGALLGFSRQEMEAMYDEIVEFAELQDHMDVKLKNFSSGMQVRLAFSIAIRSESDILLIDEVLAVGDASFQQKCFDYFAKLKTLNKTVVFVSHDRNAIRRYCTRCVYIKDGHIVMEGNSEEVLRLYEEDLLGNTPNDNLETNKKSKENKVVTITNLCINKPKNGKYFIPDEVVKLNVIYKFKENVESPILGLVVLNKDNMAVLVTNTRTKKVEIGEINKYKDLTLSYEFKNILGNGTYDIRAAISNTEGTIFLDETTKRNILKVNGNDDLEATIIYQDKLEVIYG